MSQKIWVSSTDPDRMLSLLREKGSDRKLRLFACACCRYIWDSLDETCRHAVEVAEKYADGQTRLTSLRRAEGQVGEIAFRQEAGPPDMAHWAADDRGGYTAADGVLTYVHRLEQSGVEGLIAAACTYLRDIFSSPVNPVKLPLPDDCQTCEGKGWLKRPEGQGGKAARKKRCPTCEGRCPWVRRNDGAALGVAQTIYEERDYTQLPILADALEDAGCDLPIILEHCRHPGPHVRGCWVLDLILGKE